MPKTNKPKKFLVITPYADPQQYVNLPNLIPQEDRMNDREEELYKYENGQFHQSFDCGKTWEPVIYDGEDNKK